MNAADFDGSWFNQNGSELKVTVDRVTGSISGEFDSGVGDDGKTLWVDVVGKVLLAPDGKSLEDVLVFFAMYPKYGTVVTWCGQHTLNKDGKYEIRMQWLHVTNIPDNQEMDWMWFTNRIGADVFTRNAN